MAKRTVSTLSHVQIRRAAHNLQMPGASDTEVREALRAAIRDGYKLADFDVFNAKDYPAKLFKKNPGTTIRGWVKARAVKIVRNKRGQAVSVKIRT